MNIAIDLGKHKSYVVMEEDGKVVKEGYVETTKDGFSTFFGNVKDPKIVVEACSTTNRVANILDGYDITVANPAKVRIIAESTKKTDRNDAHVLMDLFKRDYLPESWLPPREVRDARDLCRNRDFLVKQRTRAKNRIRYQSYLLGVEFKKFNHWELPKLKKYPILDTLLQELESLNDIIYATDKQIAHEVQANQYAKLIDTIPGVGKFGALSIASEIGDVSRFKNESGLFSYAGLVPRTRQSGDREFRGHITRGNVFLKTILIECVQIHLKKCPHSFVTRAYYRIKLRAGHNKAKVAAARRLLQVIYFMLKRNEVYRIYE